MNTYFNNLEFVYAQRQENFNSVFDDWSPRNQAIQLVLDGSMYFQPETQQRVILKPPAFFWISPDKTFNYGPVDDKGWTHCYVVFRGTGGERIIKEGFESINKLNYVQLEKNFSTIPGMFGKLIKIVSEQGLGINPTGYILLQQILKAVDNEYKRSSAQPDQADAIKLLADRIDIDPGRDFDFKEYSQQLCISYSKFRKMFKRIIGRSPQDYVVTRRIISATNMLIESKYNISEIAIKLGYPDTACFSRQFKKKTGHSPSDYKMKKF